jgi:hypothetical protein
LYQYTFLILVGLTLILGARQFWTLAGSFIDFKLFILFFLLSFLLKKNPTTSTSRSAKNHDNKNGNSCQFSMCAVRHKI